MISQRGHLVTLRGDSPRHGGGHNVYVILTDDDGTALCKVMHVHSGNVATVRRGRCIPVVDAQAGALPVIGTRRPLERKAQ